MIAVMKLAATAALALGIGAAPAAADPGRKNGEGRHEGRQGWHDRGDHDGGRVRHVADCPPGLAKKNPPCVPPGQARKDHVRHGTRIGDILRIGDYRIIRDLDRYDLESRRGWSYYEGADRIYRVDSETRRILAILNLVDAFAN